MIGVLADDLTGAAELGAVGLRYGLGSEVLIAERSSGDSELVCVDTDSRGCSPTEAGRRAASAANEFLSSGANWIYKKVDSVLRGPVVAELSAVMNELRLPRTLLVPVNPSLGRVIRQGRYFVRGKPLHKTEFMFDPEYPRGSSDVRQLLGDSASAIHVCRTDEPLPPVGIIVGEAETVEELQRWANRRDESMLVAGGAEFFAALLAMEGLKTASRVGGSRPSAPSAKELFVCGSTSEACCEFVAFCRKDGVPVFSLPKGMASGDAFAAAARQKLVDQILFALGSQQRVILAIGLPLVSEPSLARQLAGHLTDLAQAVLSKTSGIHIHVEGGATAINLIRRMGWTRLKVAGELPPGVVTLRADGDQTDLLTLKPGSYHWPDAIRRQVSDEETQS